MNRAMELLERHWVSRYKLKECALDESRRISTVLFGDFTNPSKILWLLNNMKATFILASVSALATQVAGHATFQQLWVNGVDKICFSPPFVHDPGWQLSTRVHVPVFQQATAPFRMCQAPTFDVRAFFEEETMSYTNLLSRQCQSRLRCFEM